MEIHLDNIFSDNWKFLLINYERFFNNFGFLVLMMVRLNGSLLLEVLQFVPVLKIGSPIV